MKQFYDGRQWHLSNDTVEVRVDDATFQRHLTAYLASQGCDTRTYLQLLEYTKQVLEQRIQATHHLCNPDYWQEYRNASVRVLPHNTYKLKT